MDNTDPVPLEYAVPERGVPTSLKVVAGLFIAGGVLSIFQILFDLLHNRISINFDVLGVFIGRGCFLKPRSPLADHPSPRPCPPPEQQGRGYATLALSLDPSIVSRLG